MKMQYANICGMTVYQQVRRNCSVKCLYLKRRKVSNERPLFPSLETRKRVNSFQEKYKNEIY